MTRNNYIQVHSMTEPWENRFKPPVGTCQRTITERNEQDRLVARVCGRPADGQACDDCEERASQVAMQFRGSGQVVSGFLTGY